MIGNEKLKNFLLNIEKFYQPEHPELKDGIGHEIEHIKGVVHRTEKIVKTINNNPEKYGEKLDLLTATSVACLHDIGNVISRDGHNFLGEGILKGNLTTENCIINNASKSSFFNNAVLKSYEDFTAGLISYKKLPKLHQEAIIGATTLNVKFNMSYNGYKNQNVSIKNFDDFLSKIPNLPQDKDFLKDIKTEFIEDGIFKEDDCHYNPELKNITKQFQDVYSPSSKEFNDIVKAVREHNVDFTLSNNGKEEIRFVSKSPYSRVIADADKDNVPETFATRTMLFALNKWVKTKHEPAFIEKDENGELKVDENKKYVPNLDMCARHVAHQANERFKYSKEEWFQETGKDENVPNFAHEIDKELNPEFGYKPRHKIKGVTSIEKGDDLFSQVDAYHGGHEIEDLRQSAVDKLRNWSRPDRIEQSMKDLRPIMENLINAPSIEAAVDVYESKYYGNVGHNSFEEIIDNIFEEVEGEKDLEEWKGLWESSVNDDSTKEKPFLIDLDEELNIANTSEINEDKIDIITESPDISDNNVL